MLNSEDYTKVAILQLLQTVSFVYIDRKKTSISRVFNHLIFRLSPIFHPPV
jgi:hypothetical protein